MGKRNCKCTPETFISLYFDTEKAEGAESHLYAEQTFQSTQWLALQQELTVARSSGV